MIHNREKAHKGHHETKEPGYHPKQYEGSIAFYPANHHICSPYHQLLSCMRYGGYGISVVYMKKHRLSEAVRIGKQLRYVRRIKDMTQEELAEAIDVSVGWVSRIERGIELPNLKLLFRIAKALRIEVKELLPL